MGTRTRIALWAVPRSVSTALERVFIERGDARVLHEPFSHAYYHGPERRSRRFADVPARPQWAFSAIAAEVLRPSPDPIVFLKDMAYHVLGDVDPGFLGNFVNTFIIRDPAESLPSLARFWPDFTDEEAGYAAQAHLFELVTGTLGAPAVVVDAGDLRRDPAGLMRAYAAAVGISHRGFALRWQAREIPLWESWKEWHWDAARSTGIRPPSEERRSKPSARVRRMIVAARPHFERLHARRLEPACG